MIFRNGWGRIEERYMDEHTILSQGHDVRIRARFDHYDFKSVGHFASKLVWYSGREVMDVLGARGGEDLQNAGIRRTRKLKTGLYYRLPRFFRVLCVFIFRYIFQLGFLDGVPGLIYHFMSVSYTHLRRAARAGRCRAPRAPSLRISRGAASLPETGRIRRCV